MSRDDPHFRLRIPQELKQQVEELAEAEDRTATAQMLRLIRIGLKAEASRNVAA